MPERKYTVEDNSEAVAALVAKVNERGFTPTQEHFGNWVVDNSGVEFSTKKEEAAARFAAKMALVLRMEHQRSPENHEAKEAARKAKEQELAARPKRSAKADVEDEAPARPARRGRKPAAAAEEAPAAPARRGRRAAAAATPATETKAPAKPARRPAATGAKRPARRGAANAEADF